MPLLPLLLALFALHTFLLMGTGTWSDLAMAGEDFAWALYYVREGVLAVGFLAYMAFARLRKPHFLASKSADVADAVLVVLFGACILVLNLSAAPGLRVPAVLVVAVLVGVSGGMVYERVALAAHQLASEAGSQGERGCDSARVLGVVVGGGGALAVVAQFALQTGLSIGVLLDVLFAVCFGLVMWLARKIRPTVADVQAADGARVGSRDVGRNPEGMGAASFACMVVAATCLFALLPFCEAAIRASGSVAVFYEWHRLFAAVGYAVIGAAAYFGGRPASSAAVLVSALFAVIASVQTAMMEAGALMAVVFYFVLAAALAWSCIAFMSAAATSKYPALVASVGRVLLVLVTLTEIPIQAAGPLTPTAVLVASAALLAAVVLSMLRGGFLQGGGTAEGAGQSIEEPAPSPEERVRLLAAECGLTDREREVLSALVLTEDKNQAIADSLFVSRRTLQKHISSIYEKTGVTTRVALVMRVNGESQTR
ncbi:MAG: helix-turn-helix transcriptional regulator [Eggerthellaceae bacterium]|nr:helix-turn-helix transcriptional regulator [Eggerthellaceae bacterium]